MRKERSIIMKVDETKCTGCGLCVDFCPVGAITVDGKAKIDAGLCARCCVCVSECPSEAIYAERKDTESASGANRFANPNPEPLLHAPFAARVSALQPPRTGGLLDRALNYLSGAAPSGQSRGMGRGGGRGGQRQVQGRRAGGCRREKRF